MNKYIQVDLSDMIRRNVGKVLFEIGNLVSDPYPRDKTFTKRGDDYYNEFITFDDSNVEVKFQKISKEDASFIMYDNTYNISFKVDGEENADKKDVDLKEYLKILSTVKSITKDFMDKFPGVSILFFAEDLDPEYKKLKSKFYSHIFDKIIPPFYHKNIYDHGGDKVYYMRPMTDKERISEERSIALGEYLTQKFKHE